MIMANAKLDCLFMDQPHQDICLSQKKSPTLKPVEKAVETQVKRNVDSYFSINTGVRNLTPFSNAILLSTYYGFQDLPWGWWRLGLEYLRVSQTENHITDIGFKLSYEKRWKRFSLLFGAKYSQQELNLYDANLDRSIISPEIGVTYRIINKKKWTLEIGVDSQIPSPIILKEAHTHNREAHDEQARLSRSVEKLDQSWSISAQVGLSYLFE